MGGGFGRRGEADFVTDAVETSKAVGKPVKVVWSREDDIQHDYYRPVTYVRMWGGARRVRHADGLHAADRPAVADEARSAALPPNGVDFISVDGAANLPYDIPNVRVEYIETDPGIPFGFWRSVGAPFQGYVVEAFIDEMATTAGKDPVSVPARSAGQGARATRRCSTWRPRRPAGVRRCPQGRGRGIAVHGVLRQHPRPGHARCR